MISEAQKNIDLPASSVAEKVPDFSAESLAENAKVKNDRIPDFSAEQSGDTHSDSGKIPNFIESLSGDSSAELNSSMVDYEEVYRHIFCRNESLAGDVHPITGVPFEVKTVEVNGEVVEGVFPEFDSVINIDLPPDLHQASNKEQFDYANSRLKEAIDADDELKGNFNEEQLEQIANGDRPDGFVWHHSEMPGVLQLVDKDIHDKTGHTGGQVIWGGGQENR